MTVQLSVKVDVKQITKELSRLQKQSIPLATAKALTFTAERAQKQVAALIPQVFSNPTNFTRKSVRKSSATVRRLTSEVFLKDISFTRQHYLTPHIKGGLRPQKRAEKRLGGYWVPGKDAKRNAYGNLTKGTWSKMLADVGRFGMFTGDAANTLTKAQGGEKNIRFFMRRVGGRRIIFKRVTKHRIVPWLIEILLPPVYRRRFPFFKTILRVKDQQFSRLFDKQMNRELVKRGLR